ncbi:MAG: hypothetical protein U9R48_04805 [Chloroflexota bacterium]|nr:hypothetical protein [Chloroflexota bacterium]
MRGKWRYLTIALLWSLCLGGCASVDRLTNILYPTQTPWKDSSRPLVTTTATATRSATAQRPTTTPVRTSTAIRGEPTKTPSIPPTPRISPSPEPAPDEQQSLVFAHDGNIYRGDYFGQQPTEIASVPRLEAWDFAQGRLAIAQEGHLDIIDFNRGKLHSAEIEEEIIYAHVLWSGSGRNLLHAAIVDDETAPTFGRSVDLRAFGCDGKAFGKMRIKDVNGVNLLHYDDVSGQVLLIPFGGDPSFTKADYYNLESGERRRTIPIRGEGEVAVSPDGRYLLTEWLSDQGGAQLLLYHLSTEAEEARPRTWEHPSDSHSVSHIWSPNGEYVAYLLQDGTTFAESSKGLGLWVLDVASMQAKKVMEEAALSSTVVGWTPDGDYIVAYHRGTEGDSYFYMIRPHGGDRRLLTVPPQGEILGWMTPPEEPVAEKVVIDPWQGRFEDVEGEAEAMAQVVAEFVAANADTDTETLSRDLRAHLEKAGWSADVMEPHVKRLADQIFVAQLPPFSIYVLDSGEAHFVGNGHLVLDARLEGDDLGVILGTKDQGYIQPTYTLLHRQADGPWAPLWTPQGRRDWVATDGEIQFVGSGLGRLRVRGSSFGLAGEENQIFVECRECPHRWLTATWRRTDGAYERESDLPSDASLPQIFWEMTERRPYALLHECLRRLRQGLPADELVASPQVANQVRTLGLLKEGVRLMAEEETKEGVRFSDVEGKATFYASIQDERLLRVERVVE